MSEHDNTGGPAFPVTFQHDDSSTGCTSEHMGMGLRDYFACKAMQSFIIHNAMQDQAKGFCVAGSAPWDELDIAEFSYAQADAMLKAREA